jgi:hypothetical protein
MADAPNSLAREKIQLRNELTTPIHWCPDMMMKGHEDKSRECEKKGSYALMNCIEGKEEVRIGEIANIRRTIHGLRKKCSQIIFEVEVEMNCGSKSNNLAFAQDR